jgi:hypothetical protein
MLRQAAAATTMLAVASIATAQLVTAPPRDRQQAPQAGTGVIKGRIVDAQAGTAVPRARVRLAGSGGGQRPLVLTDESGSFVFTALPAGAYWVQADKTGYLPGRYPETGQTLRNSFRPVSLADGQVLDGVTVPLFRGGVIAGRVVDANGDPVEHANVQTLRLPRSGHGNPQTRGGASTNDLGEFRAAHLEPGKYVVLVMPNRNVFGSPDGSDAVPLTTFYPGVPTMDLAQPIVVERGGSVTSLEITLIDGLAAVVTGTVLDSSGKPVTRNANVSFRPLVQGMASYSATTSTGVKPDGTFQFSLSPGEYEVEARAFPQPAGGPPPTGAEQFGKVRLSVAGDVSGVTITLGSGARVSGRLVFDGTGPVPSLTSNNNIAMGIFTPQDGSPNCRSGRADLAADGTFTVEGIFGTCVARLMGFGQWTTKSIVYDGKELLDQSITFEQGQQFRDVQVILTDQHPELTLRVVDEHGTPTREYVALVFPVDKARWTDSSRYIRSFVPSLQQQMTGYLPGGGGLSAAMSRPDTVPGLFAGQYYAVALDDIESEASRDPETLDRLSRAATRLTLAADSRIEISLKRVKLADLTPDR